MKGDILLNAIGEIDEKYITSAERSGHRPLRYVLTAVAACLCVAVFAQVLPVQDILSRYRDDFLGTASSCQGNMCGNMREFVKPGPPSEFYKTADELSANLTDKYGSYTPATGSLVTYTGDNLDTGSSSLVHNSRYYVADGKKVTVYDRKGSAAVIAEIDFPAIRMFNENRLVIFVGMDDDGEGVIVRAYDPSDISFKKPWYEYYISGSFEGMFGINNENMTSRYIVLTSTPQGKTDEGKTKLQINGKDINRDDESAVILGEPSTMSYISAITIKPITGDYSDRRKFYGDIETVFVDNHYIMPEVRTFDPERLTVRQSELYVFGHSISSGAGYPLGENSYKGKLSLGEWLGIDPQDEPSDSARVTDIISARSCSTGQRITVAGTDSEYVRGESSIGTSLVVMARSVDYGDVRYRESEPIGLSDSAEIGVTWDGGADITVTDAGKTYSYRAEFDGINVKLNVKS